MDHIKQISPALSEIKTGTPAYKIDDKVFVGGIGGNYIPGIIGTNVSDTTAVASDVASGKYFYTASGVRTAGTSSGGSTDFYKCVDINFGTATQSTTDIELVGSFIVSSPWGGGGTDYSYLAGVYTLIDSSATGKSRQWSRTSGSTTYYIYYSNDMSCWAVNTDTSGGVILATNSGGDDPTGGWHDFDMGGTAEGFSRYAISLTPPAQKTWSGYKEVTRDGITFYDTSTLYTNLTYDKDYPIPGKVYNANRTVEKLSVASTAPLSFYAREAGSIFLRAYVDQVRATFKYRIGTSGNWITMTKDQEISVSQGSIIQFKNESTVCNYSGDESINNITIDFYSGKFEGGGNIMSMVNWADTGCFYNLFQNGTARETPYTSLVAAPDLPMKKLKGGCYTFMFKAQAGLLIPPEIFATEAEEGADMGYMFKQCESLTYLPEIRIRGNMPSTTDFFYPYTGRVCRFATVSCSSFSNLYMEYDYSTRPIGILFKSTTTPTEIGASTIPTSNCRVPDNWVIVNKD